MKSDVIAISLSDMQRFGCPHCGYRSGHISLSAGGVAVWKCGSEECRKICCILINGIKKSPIGFDGFFPELQKHPREGIPSHGNPDKKPEGGGEFFRCRGIGSDVTPGCFVCGGDRKIYENIAAFVQCKESGERIVGMFSEGAWLDYRHHEPDYVQVKIGACRKHIKNLRRLRELSKDGIINEDRIKKAIA